MKVKNIIYEDFINYKKPSMFIGMPNCSFKCDKEAGCKVCQNSDLAAAPIIEIDDKGIIQRYIDNPITEAVCFGGLEPFDNVIELLSFIILFREKSNDDIVVYTGYYPNEIPTIIQSLKVYSNIIIKFGRFIPNKPNRYDELLGVTLVSDNQYAIRLEDIG